MFDKKSMRAYELFNTYKSSLGIEGDLNSAIKNFEWDLLSVFGKIAYAGLAGFSDQVYQTNLAASLVIPPIMSGIKANLQVTELEEDKGKIDYIEDEIKRTMPEYGKAPESNIDFNKLKQTATVLKASKTTYLVGGAYFLARVGGIIYQQYQNSQM